MECIDTHIPQCAGIRGHNATSGHYLDASTSYLHGATYVVDAIYSLVVASRGEYARTPRSDDILDGPLVVRGHIHGAMEGCLHTSRGLHKVACALYIYASIGREDAKDYACGSRRAGTLDVEEHRPKFIVGV